MLLGSKSQQRGGVKQPFLAEGFRAQFLQDWGHRLFLLCISLLTCARRVR